MNPREIPTIDPPSTPEATGHAADTTNDPPEGWAEAVNLDPDDPGDALILAQVKERKPKGKRWYWEERRRAKRRALRDRG